jgi:hypothetical protein
MFDMFVCAAAFQEGCPNLTIYADNLCIFRPYLVSLPLWNFFTRTTMDAPENPLLKVRVW